MRIVKLLEYLESGKTFNGFVGRGVSSETAKKKMYVEFKCLKHFGFININEYVLNKNVHYRDTTYEAKSWISAIREFNKQSLKIELEKLNKKYESIC